MVRAKFICQRHEIQKYAGSETTTIILTAVSPYNDKDYDAKAFWEASPSGELKINIVNKRAADYFVPGKKYYLDFTKAAEVEE